MILVGSPLSARSYETLYVRDQVEGLHHAWGKLAPDLPARVEGTAARTAPKAWRFAGEMREIADTFEGAGLPDGFHRAAAEIYGWMESLKPDDAPRDLQSVLACLRAPRGRVAV